MRSAIARLLRRLSYRIEPHAPDLPVVSRGPISLDVRMARDLGWSNVRIECVWQSMEIDAGMFPTTPALWMDKYK